MPFDTPIGDSAQRFVPAALDTKEREQEALRSLSLTIERQLELESEVVYLQGRLDSLFSSETSQRKADRTSPNQSVRAAGVSESIQRRLGTLEALSTRSGANIDAVVKGLKLSIEDIRSQISDGRLPGQESAALLQTLLLKTEHLEKLFEGLRKTNLSSESELERIVSGFAAVQGTVGEMRAASQRLREDLKKAYRSGEANAFHIKELELISNGVLYDLEELDGSVAGLRSSQEELHAELALIAATSKGNLRSIAGLIATSDRNSAAVSALAATSNATELAVASITLRTGLLEGAFSSLELNASAVTDLSSSIASIRLQASKTQARIDQLVSFSAADFESIAGITQTVSEMGAQLVLAASYGEQLGPGQFIDDQGRLADENGPVLVGGEFVYPKASLATIGLLAGPNGSLITLAADNIDLEGVVSVINSGGQRTLITGAGIDAASISTRHLRVSARELVPDFSFTGSAEGWDGFNDGDLTFSGGRYEHRSHSAVERVLLGIPAGSTFALLRGIPISQMAAVSGGGHLRRRLSLPAGR